VKLQERGAPFGGLASHELPPRVPLLTKAIEYGEKTFAIADSEIRKLRHDPTDY